MENESVGSTEGCERGCVTIPVACPGLETCSRLSVIDASGSIPAKSETVHADYPMSKEFMHALPVFLTDVELGCFSKQQAELWTKWGRLNQAKKDSAKSYGDQIKKVEDELDEVTRIVEEGSEERPVMCRWMFNYAENEKILVRQDSNSIVERKTISKEEMERWRNPELPIESPENVEDNEEATDTLNEPLEAAEGGKTEEPDAILASDASTTIEEELKNDGLWSKEDDEERWPDPPVPGSAATPELSANIDKNRRCCMPKDRDFHTEGNVRTMYCRVCGLIINKEDMSKDLPEHVPFIHGEKFEVSA